MSSSSGPSVLGVLEPNNYTGIYIAPLADSAATAQTHEYIATEDNTHIALDVSTKDATDVNNPIVVISRYE